MQSKTSPFAEFQQPKINSAAPLKIIKTRGSKTKTSPFKVLKRRAGQGGDSHVFCSCAMSQAISRVSAKVFFLLLFARKREIFFLGIFGVFFGYFLVFIGVLGVFVFVFCALARSFLGFIFFAMSQAKPGISALAPGWLLPVLLRKTGKNARKAAF